VTELQGALAPAGISLDQSLERDLGIGSLERVELLLRLEQAFGVRLTDAAMMEAESPRDLARAILTAGPGAPERVPAPVAPLAAVLMITLIVASIIGAGRQEIIAAGPRLIVAVFLLHSGGFLLGYVLSRLVGGHEIASRTISIEVGMQNSGLGVVLARQNFASPLFAIPSAISSLFHSLIASALAALWRRTASRYATRPEVTVIG